LGPARGEGRAQWAEARGRSQGSWSGQVLGLGHYAESGEFASSFFISFPKPFSNELLSKNKIKIRNNPHKNNYAPTRMQNMFLAL
jgi:hypothetical protein